jgi:stage II sporulation protein M
VGGYWRRMRGLFGLALFLFVAGGVAGGVFHGALADALQPLLRSLTHKAHVLRGDTAGSLMIALFVNNLRASVLMMVGGAAFGLIPLLGITSNGALVGDELAILALTRHISPWKALLFGILPHGIFEIPAYALACAVGFRLGWLVWRGLLGQGSGSAEWRTFIKDGAISLAAIVVLLVIAAFFESHVTPVLVQRYLK